MGAPWGSYTGWLDNLRWQQFAVVGVLFTLVWLMQFRPTGPKQLTAIALAAAGSFLLFYGA